MNENPEGTPNPLNPAPGTGEEMAAGTGTLDFVETAQESDVMSGPETPAAPEVPEVQEVQETQEVAEVQEPVAAEPANTAEPVNIAAFATATETTQMADPMMRPVSQSNFDTLGTENASANNIPVEEIKEESFSVAEVTPTEPEPMPEFIPKGSIVEPAGKNGKKKAFAIGAIVFIMIAIICGAAAIAIMMMGNNTGDRVSKAIEKLINGQVSNLVTVQGNINSLSDADDAAFNSLNIDFNGSFDNKTGINSVSAKVSSEIPGNTKISIGVDEIKNDDGETFIKVRGLDTLMGTAASGEPTTVNLADCVNGSNGTDNCAVVSESTATIGASDMLSIYSGLFSVINDQWILISDDFGENMEGIGIFDNSSTCIIDALSTLPKYSKDIAEKYKANEFVTYSNDKLEISKKKNELYKLGVNSEKFSAFINSLSNNGFINELNACAGNTATNTKVSAEMVEAVFAEFPTIYVEIDDNFNFTRVYFKANTGEGDNTTTITADLALSYPPKIEVETPEEYVEMSTLVNNLLTSMLSGATE